MLCLARYKHCRRSHSTILLRYSASQQRTACVALYRFKQPQDFGFEFFGTPLSSETCLAVWLTILNCSSLRSTCYMCLLTQVPGYNIHTCICSAEGAEPEHTRAHLAAAPIKLHLAIDSRQRLLHQRCKAMAGHLSTAT